MVTCWAQTDYQGLHTKSMGGDFDPPKRQCVYPNEFGVGHHKYPVVLETTDFMQPD